MSSIQSVIDEQVIPFNGIDPDSGEYLTPEITFNELAARIKRPISKKEAADSQRREDERKPTLAGRLGKEVDDLKYGGWGFIMPPNADPVVRQQLERLLNHRAKQVNNDKLVKVLAYSGEKTSREWLLANNIQPGDIEPWRVPYYLLFVGSPDDIPFHFTRELARDYAVGRLHFDDVSGYKRYVDSLIAYESGDNASASGEVRPRSKEAVFFRTDHDQTTHQSAINLVEPLTNGEPELPDGTPEEPPIADNQGFRTRRVWDDRATKEVLSSIFAPPSGTPLPAFFFSATHGAGFREPKPGQERINGALRCQDNELFGGDSIADLQDARVHGLVTFMFACYSAGTPKHDEFPFRLDREPATIAERSFVAALPKELLSHKNGGAIACIGHMDQAWSYSFTQRGRRLLIPYRNAIERILLGMPIGLALQDLMDRYGSLSNSLVQALYQIAVYGANINDKDLVNTWCQRNEAGGYILIGDPAARLRVETLLDVHS